MPGEGKGRMRRVTRPIVVTVSLTVLLVITLVSAGLVAQRYLANRDQYQAGLRTRLVASADRAAIGLALPIWNIDREQIDRVVESAMREEEIFAVVAQAAGRTHAFVRDGAWRPVASAAPLLPADLLREERTVAFSREPIGSVVVYATGKFAEERLRQWLLSALVAFLLAALTAVAAVTLLLWRLVLEPLRTLERYAEAVSSGRRPEVGVGGAPFRGEVDGLRASIERMVGQLDARYQVIRALAARLQAVREEEKARIARDLHDDLGQMLTGLKMDLRWVERRLGNLGSSSEANAILDQVVAASALADQTVATVQRIAADLRPSALDQLGLGAALHHEARRFQERSGIACQVVLAEDLPQLRGEAATALYRIGQEALTNVARHAGASRVVISLAADPDAVTLRVEDDGRGIGDAGAGPQSLGILGMKERATMLGGDVTFARGGERGTIVTLKVPLARVAEPASGAGT